jgi:hypothetical protein
VTVFIADKLAQCIIMNLMRIAGLAKKTLERYQDITVHGNKNQRSDMKFK